MNLTFAEDFTHSSILDDELLGVPDSGLFWNRGTHPIITVDNILSELTKETITFSAYNPSSTYSKFMDSRAKRDIVTYNNEIYQSSANSNQGNTPSTSTNYWLKTNLESLRIKSFIFSVEDNVLAALSINRKLIENQYIYNVGEDLHDLTNDYAAWVFEPKGSDYVRIRVNQISFQANTTTPQSLYVINQGRLIDSITLNPNNGILEFEDVGINIYAKGRTILAVDSQQVRTQRAYVKPLRYESFVAYPMVGTGATPEGAEYSESNYSNGLNFNISTYLDSSVYIANNAVDLAKFYQCQFAYDFAKHIVHRADNRFNVNQRNRRENDLIVAESMDLAADTIARRYAYQKKEAVKAINATFDKFMKKKSGLRIKRKTI